eukprot:TRINITY_DN27150_c0_g1_i1.p1 TRINITY_DN27150_c0_g1~~TRINITY_DN27150_c0_g1_i1.p1  ORF type:complete len:565 (-),score=130.47 TRINITY_DN27150_c0_g1_i1:134-1717(-)
MAQRDRPSGARSSASRSSHGELRTFASRLALLAAVVGSTADGSAGSSPATVVLLGPSGSGKSETGNTLVGSLSFKVSGGLESETLMPQAQSMSYAGRSWQIVDTPGYFDTTRTPEELEAALAQFSEIVGDRIAALAFVVPYGRFGDAHLRAWRLLRGSFGPAAAKHTALVFTSCGDKTEEEIRGETQRLCAKTPPPLLCSVLDDLRAAGAPDDRIVALGKLEPERRERDRARMLSLAAELERAGGGSGYNHADFVRARSRRKALAARIAALSSAEKRGTLELLLRNVEAGAESDDVLARRLEEAEGLPQSQQIFVDFEDRTLGPFKQFGSGWRQPMPMPYNAMKGYSSSRGGGSFFVHTGTDSGVKVRHGDKRTGELRTEAFRLGRGPIEWEATGAGGSIAVCRADGAPISPDDSSVVAGASCLERRVLRLSTGLEPGILAEEELTTLVGEDVYLRIVDDRATGWGFIALDNLAYPTMNNVDEESEATSADGADSVTAEASGSNSASAMEAAATASIAGATGAGVQR